MAPPNWVEAILGGGGDGGKKYAFQMWAVLIWNDFPYLKFAFPLPGTPARLSFALGFLPMACETGVS